MLHVFTGDFSVAVDVQLKKLDLSRNGSIYDFIEGTRSEGGYLAETDQWIVQTKEE